MLLKLWRSTTPPSTSAWILQSSRFSSYSCYNSTTSPGGDDYAPKSSWTKMIKEYPDPELYRMLRASQGRITKEFYASLQAEPELFLRFREQKSVTESKHYATDAKYRAARIKKAKAWNEAHKHDEDFTRRQKIYNWCFRRESFKRHPWTKNLPWTTHRPVVYTDKVSHYCAGCGCHRLGYKAWWQSMEDPNSFLCHKHYANRGWSEIMPKGYEDVRTLEELRVRYEELNQK